MKNRNSIVNNKISIISFILFFNFLILPVFGQSKFVPRIRQLTPGRIIEGRLAGKQSHKFYVRVKAAQFLEVKVIQKGINLVVSLILPGEKKMLLQVNSPNGTQGPEVVSWITEVGGNYLIEVAVEEDLAPSGNYGIQLQPLRLPTENDQKKVRADAFYAESVSLYEKAFAESNKEFLEAALSRLESARVLYSEIGAKAEEGFCFLAQGRINDLLGNNQKALDLYDQALPLHRAAEDKTTEATTLNNIGLIYDKRGEKQKAFDQYKKALTLFKDAKDKAGEAMTLHNIGDAYSDLGEYRKALEYFEKALPIRRIAEDKNGEATTLNSMGMIYSTLGEKGKAITRFFNKALPLFRLLKDKDGESMTLHNIANVYDNIGEKEKALKSYKQILSLTVKSGNRQGEATTLNNIGTIYDDLGDTAKALETYKQSLRISIKIEDRNGEANAYNNIGLIYQSSNDKSKAFDCYNKALGLYRAVGNIADEATTLKNIGTVYADFGDKQEAIKYFAQALPLYRFVEDKSGEANTLNNYSKKLISPDNPRFAAFLSKQAVNLYQKLRSNIKGLEKSAQQTFLKSIELVYRQLADILIKDNRLEEAHQVLNAFKDQQFFDFEAANKKDLTALTGTSFEKNLNAVYDQHIENIVKLNFRVGELRRKSDERSATADEASELVRLESALKQANEDFLKFFNLAESESMELTGKNDKVGEIPDVIQLQSTLRELGQQTGRKAVAVYQLIGEENFRAIIIPADGEIKSVSTPIKSKELNEKASKLWGLLQSDKYDTTKLSKEIYEIVFKPLEAKIPEDATTIMWSLDGNLRYIPMAALFDGEKFLVERYKNVVFTRADTERLTRAVSSVWTGAGFSSSQKHTVEIMGRKISFNALPGANEELRLIFGRKNLPNVIVSGEAFPDAKFNRKNFFGALKRKQPLAHISSHFSFQPGDEAGSILLLGDGTTLSLEEIKREVNLFQGLELLTLSACNTAAQQPGANGREIDGFAELAQRLGAGAVMATLWQVSDASTPWLMRDFYINRQEQNGMTKAEALQKAQIALLHGTARIEPLRAGKKADGSPTVKGVIVAKSARRSAGNQTRSDMIYLDESEAAPYKKEGTPKYAHPYYWSSFVLFGNWR